MLVLRQAARKSEQTERAGDKKSHKGGSSLQVNIRQYSRSIGVRAWLFDYEFLKKSAQWPRSSVLGDLWMYTAQLERMASPPGCLGDAGWPGEISCALVTKTHLVSVGRVNWRFDVAHALWF
jgi:hypothetical protein